MSKKRIQIIIPIILFLFPLIASNVIAKEDFKIEGKQLIELCQCMEQRYYITVANTGDTTSAYSISQKDKSDWLNPYPFQFVLKPGQKSKVPVNINLPCNVAGRLNATLIIATNKGIAKALKQSYLVKSCHDYELNSGALIDDKVPELKFNIYDGVYSLCEGQKHFIPLFFRNSAEFSNSYSIDADGEDWVSTDIKEFSLGKQQSGVVLLELKPPENSKGYYKFSVISTPKVGGQRKEIAIEANVEKCHDLNLILPEDGLKLCSGDKTDYAIAAENSGINPEVVTINPTGADWVKISQNYLTIGPGETSVFMILASPDVDTSGTFNIGIEAYSKSINKSAQLSLEVLPRSSCYEAGIVMKDIITNRYALSYTPIKIRNNGIRTALYELSVEGLNWVSVEPKKIEIEPGKLFNLNIRLNPDANATEGSYEASLNLKADNTEYSKEFKILLKKKSGFEAWLEWFYNYYKYYIYLALFILVIIILLLLGVPTKIKNRYRKYKIRQNRLRALKKAREARRKKKDKKQS